MKEAKKGPFGDGCSGTIQEKERLFSMSGHQRMSQPDPLVKVSLSFWYRFELNQVICCLVDI